MEETVINNIEIEHLDYFKNFEKEKESFNKFDTIVLLVLSNSKTDPISAPKSAIKG